MRAPLLLTCSVLLAVVGTAPARAQANTAPPSDSALLAAFATFPAGYGENLPDFGPLYQNPSHAARLLIARLQPVDRGKYASAPAVVWYIRALRALTGLDFRARTDSALVGEEDEQENTGGGERWFLRPDSLANVAFFGTWMSRDLTWVAPRDAQIRIIAKWRQWFRAHGSSFRYINDHNDIHWYY